MSGSARSRIWVFARAGLLFVAGAMWLAGSGGARGDDPPGRLDFALEQMVSPGEGRLASQGGVMTPQSRDTQTDDVVRVVVETRPGREDDAVDGAESLGEVEGTYGSLVQVSVPVSELRALANAPGVERVRLPLQAYPATMSEGVALTNADDWQAAGLTGAGVKVAILDLGFQGYEAKLGTELPASVTVMSFVAGGDIYGGGETHGTGVAEVVYDMAPGAQLFLANFDTEVELAAAADWLQAQGVQVINASWGYFTSGPGDGTGLVDGIIADSVADGVFWSVAAGNHANKHYTAQFRDTDGNGWHEFALSPVIDEGNSLGFFTFAGTPMVVEIKWDDPYGASCRDYDLYIKRTDNQNQVVTVGASENEQYDGTACVPGADPVEIVTVTAPVTDEYHITIREFFSASDAQITVFSAYQDIEYVVQANSLMQPGDSPYVTTVAAVPQSSPGTIESFSSRGPTTDGRIKPDISGPDGVSNSTYGAFYGTSAASPHIAGAAALVLGRLPCLSPAQVGTTLTSQVVDLGAAGKDNTFGAGRLLFGAVPPDGDADTVGNTCDNCPTAPNANQLNQDGDQWGDACEYPPCVTAATAWQTPADDDDCDGYPSTLVAIGRGPETFIGTSTSIACAATPAANDEGGADAWPADFNDDQKATILDVGTYSSRFGSVAPNAPYAVRWDLNADGRITILDVGQFSVVFGKSCAP